MVGSLDKDLFGTSTFWLCHRVRQMCLMGSDSSGRLDHFGHLDFGRVRVWKSKAASRGSSGLFRVMITILDATSLLKYSWGGGNVA